MAQHAIGTPFLRKLDDTAREIAAVLLEFRFKAGKESESIGGRYTARSGAKAYYVKKGILSSLRLEQPLRLMPAP